MDAIHKQNAYIITNHLDSVLIAENNMDNTSNIAKRIISKLSKFMREFKTKEDVIGTLIKCTSKEQGELIIKFYEDLGIVNDETLSGNSIGVYYGPALTGVIDMFYDIPKGYKRIRPRLMPRYIPKPKFPRVMWVSDSKEIWTKAVVIAKINKFERKYIASTLTDDLGQPKVDRMNSVYSGYRYAKEINK